MMHSLQVQPLTERYVKVDGFHVDVDVTANISGHAVAVLLDGPSAYARGAMNDDPFLSSSSDGSDSSAGGSDSGSTSGQGVNKGGVEQTAQGGGVGEGAGQRRLEPILLGPAWWRERVLQQLGWIVLRVHWEDWCRACEDGQAGQSKLLQAVLAEAGL